MIFNFIGVNCYICVSVSVIEVLNHLNGTFALQCFGKALAHPHDGMPKVAVNYCAILFVVKVRQKIK